MFFCVRVNKKLLAHFLIFSEYAGRRIWHLNPNKHDNFCFQSTCMINSSCILLLMDEPSDWFHYTPATPRGKAKSINKSVKTRLPQPLSFIRKWNALAQTSCYNNVTTNVGRLQHKRWIVRIISSSCATVAFFSTTDLRTSVNAPCSSQPCPRVLKELYGRV